MDDCCVTVSKEKDKKEKRKKKKKNRRAAPLAASSVVINGVEWRIREKKRSLVKVAYRKVPPRSPFRIHLAIISRTRARTARSYVVHELHRVCIGASIYREYNNEITISKPRKVNQSKFRVPATFCSRHITRAFSGYDNNRGARKFLW